MRDPNKDASDGFSSAPVNETLAKTLKRLGYPEVQQDAKPSSVIPKALGAATKRLKQLDMYRQMIAKLTKPSELVVKTCP